jgi:uncharacterized membrane protein YphA (DoxX/SURF4 family)
LDLEFLDRCRPFAQLVMRLVLGAIMIGHGYSKVFGGFHHHQAFVGSLGIMVHAHEAPPSVDPLDLPVEQSVGDLPGASASMADPAAEVRRERVGVSGASRRW